MLKIILSLAFCLSLSPGLFSQSVKSLQGPAWASVSASGSGTVKLSFVETPRFVYRDANGQLTGISVDIMNDFIEWVSKNKNVKLTADFIGEGTSFMSMYQKVKVSSGGVFGLGNITITNERKKEVKFSPPFITNFAVLISNTKLPPLNQLQDVSKVFKGGHAYTAKGTINETRMLSLKQQYFKDMEIILTANSQETLDNIVKDPLGYGYLDLAFYLDAVQLKKNIRRNPAGDKSAEQFGFIMPMNSDWAPLFDEFFIADGGYVNTAKYRSILQKHLGEAGMKLLKTSL
jgi:ABC-type amino acid transport substrate-binding protein